VTVVEGPAAERSRDRFAARSERRRASRDQVCRCRTQGLRIRTETRSQKAARAEVPSHPLRFCDETPSRDDELHDFVTNARSIVMEAVDDLSPRVA